MPETENPARLKSGRGSQRIIPEPQDIREPIAARLRRSADDPDSGLLVPAAGLRRIAEYVERIESTTSAGQAKDALRACAPQVITLCESGQMDRAPAGRLLQDAAVSRGVSREEAWSIWAGAGMEANPQSRILDGATFILDQPAGIPSVWGEGENVLWARGEPLLIVGPQGVGKTTLAGQLTLALIGLRPTLLGFPVEPVGRVLYVAADRPAQAARSFARMVSEPHRAVLAERLHIHKGPPENLARDPSALVALARSAGAGAVILDSLKDCAAELSKDETGSGLNQAMQLTVAADIQVAGLHHQRKRGQQSGAPKSLDDVYGSTWITAGAGSVLLLWGNPGDGILELRHLKQPSAEVGPMRVRHDAASGSFGVSEATDVTAILAAFPEGASAQDVARNLFETEAPSPNEIEKARRQLENATRADLVLKVPGNRGGSSGSSHNRYRLRSLRLTEKRAADG